MIRLLVGVLVFVINVVYANRPYPASEHSSSASVIELTHSN
jgi:hypothetical protein